MFCTGGAGYIGIPCLVELLEAGFMPNYLSTDIDECNLKDAVKVASTPFSLTVTPAPVRHVLT
ncbi:hypothetical protein DAPPUDRAFT_261903 [Daphnia pulex]|uniref:Uncharacterized protein n=1 Tax=Daphnia pulex TaxID=6669 RepID=E9HLW8_DAPPU|nr:hypothetical protein DAPPUDRAFT_261903 [Daphnia pulex]|eukprot:EFX67266.1 hypothetical protein DAPPUDRAFT_261903 [Daphnia pulex]